MSRRRIKGSNSESASSRVPGPGSDTVTQFPQRAPIALVEHYKQRSAQLEAARVGGYVWSGTETDWDPELVFALREMDVCALLLNEDEELLAVWRALSGRKPKWNDENLKEMVREIVAEMVEYPDRTQRAPKAHAKALQRIGEMALKLRALVAQCEEDLSPAGVADLAARLEIRPLETWLQRQGIDRRTARRVALGIPKWIREESHRNEYATTFADVLEYLAELAEKRAEIAPAIGKPAAKRAAVFSLELKLTEFFSRLLGTPLTAHAATLSSAAYRTRITEDDLKKFVRSRKARQASPGSEGKAQKATTK